MSLRRAESRGAAIVMALLVVALSTAVATALSTRMVGSLDGLREERELAQGERLARAALDWVSAIMDADAALTRIDHPAEAWAQSMLPIPIGQEGALRGQILDATAYFNLNNLVDERGLPAQKWITAYVRLLDRLGLPAHLADTLVDWLDRDTLSRVHGGMEVWEGNRVAPSTFLRQPGELADVPGYDQNVIARLAPHVLALPAATTINANTATREVLAALGTSPGRVDAFLEERSKAPFLDKADLARRMEALNLNIPEEMLDVASSWFLAIGEFRKADRQQNFDALLSRLDRKSRIVWWRTRNISARNS